MKTKQITTAKRALAISHEVPSNQIQAFADTMVKAQLEAISVNPDPTTAQHFDTIISSLHSLCWTVTKLGDYTYQPGVGTVQPIGICANAMTNYVKNFLPFISDSVIDPSTYLPQVTDALRHPPLEVEIALSQWWGISRYSASANVFLSGPLISMFGAPSMMLNYFALTFEATNWHSLLDEYPASALGCRCTSLMMFLNMSAYDRIKDAVAAEIAQTSSTEIHTTQLDF